MPLFTRIEAMKASSNSALAALSAVSILQGLPAFACTESIRSQLIQQDRILSRYKQAFRERAAVIELRNPATMPALCRSTRELADLEREWLNYDNIVKYTCPAFHQYALEVQGSRSELIEKNYEISQKMIGICAQQGF